MKSSVALVALSGICAALTACGGSPSIPTPPAMKPAAAPAAPSAVASARLGQAGPSGAPLIPQAPAVPAPEVPKYEDKGRKDPFTEVQLSTVSGGLAVATTKLTGIVRGPRSTLALLETQEGIGYILKPGDTLGDGRLMEIGADNVVFAVAPKPGAPAQRVVLRLAAN